MTVKSLGNPFSKDSDLRHGAGCTCDTCTSAPHAAEAAPMSSEEMLEQAVESAIVRSVFGHNDLSRRSFMGMVGGTTAAAALASVFPMDQAKAAILDNLGPPEKTDLNIGFVPITCATPIIMAQPLGFYERYGLNAQVIKTAGWAVARDKSLSGEYDASHMLTPMPLAMTLGAGSVAEPYIMPAVENINGQAIVL
ncbi:MAG: ABC transporter substrate-binding protein, partial [Pseudomonadota bacterium]